MSDEMIRRLILLAYERGWGDACSDHMLQREDASHPIGSSKARDVGEVLRVLDPHNVLGLLA